MMRRLSDGRSKVQSTLAGNWRRMVSGVALALGLGLFSTAVAAYNDLPKGSVRYALGGLLPSGISNLPHVAHSLTAGEPLRIVAFGSSSTEGIGASTPAAAYPARLEAVLTHERPEIASRVTVLNRGIGGEAVDEMLARLDRDVIEARPQLVIWQTGSNDPLRGVSLEHFRGTTIAAIRRIREAGIDVVLMEPQWCPKLDATPGAYRFRDAVREIGAELDAPVIRRSDMMQAWIAEGRLTREQLFASDGLHMTDGGYDLLAKAAAAEILGTVTRVQMAAASVD